MRSSGGEYSIASGVGAGAGAALVMMAVMAALRFGAAVPTVPELMLGPILRFMGGQAFSAQLDIFYYAGRPLLFTLVLEGTLLLGALLGLLYAWLGRPNPHAGRRPAFFRTIASGLLYGLALGALLNIVFLPALGEAPFAVRATEVYSNTPVPLWANLMLLALLFGVTLHMLLPKPSTPASNAGGETPFYLLPERNRRSFLRIAGGGLMAIVGGGIFWYAGTVLNQGGFTSPVDRPAPDEAASISNGSDPVPAPEDAPTPRTVGRARSTEAPAGTPTALSTEVVTETPTEVPTETPAPTATVQQEELPTVEPPTATPDVPPTVAPEPPTPLPTATAEPTATDTPVIAQATYTPALPASLPIALWEVTPVANFYHVSKNFFDPSPSSAGWTLSVRGLVVNPYSLTYKQLTALPAKEIAVGMMCISNPIGGGLIGNQTWKGVALADLLKKAKVRAGAQDVVLHADDGYTDSIPVAKALDPNVALVWEMGGDALTSEHGYPARLLVPGIYGMKHVKWLNSIELVGYDYKGYWQQPEQGWSEPAPVNTMSRIDTPTGKVAAGKEVIVSGIAFAGDRSISKVEVSTDGGATWNAAYLKLAMSGTSWALWAYSWRPKKAGKYTLLVRATDGLGNLQTARRTDAYPNGATGYHALQVQVK